MSTPRRDPQQFVEAWKGRKLTERAGSHVHFVELCRMLGVPYPHEHREDDATYCFDALTAAAGSHQYSKHAKKRGTSKKDSGPELFGPEDGEGPALPPPAHAPGLAIVRAPTEGHGFADVWKAGHFCWEYKRQGRHADLAAALRQLKEYKDSLDNPPLLIVCDVDNFEIHTNFTGHPTELYEFCLEDLAETPRKWRDKGLSPINFLRYAFTDPEWFRPKERITDITEDFAAQIGRLAVEIRERNGNDPHDVAHFLMQVVFAFFAEDVGLLPRDLFTELIANNTTNPERFERQLRELFGAMESGGGFGLHDIQWFNGGLFSRLKAQAIPRLKGTEIGQFKIIAGRDWSAIEPSILGTLFERSLDPNKRSQIGAHYTSRDDIMLIVEPVVMAPLRREWDEVREKGEAAILGSGGAASGNGQRRAIRKALKGFADRLASIRILDPACGSGNFLYVAIQCLLDLEKQVITFARSLDLNLDPKVSPNQLFGIEINDYAAELARISIWIGYLKWQRENGMTDTGKRPILDALDTIECRDAILKCDNDGKPTANAADWPEADFIIGNPPFLGTKMLRGALGDDYVESLFEAYRDRIPGFSDLVCYWFELARSALERRPATRAGLLATQAIRNTESRTVLERIKQTGDIFMAWSDRRWVLDGAAVHVSMIGFDSGSESDRVFDGVTIGDINANLTIGADLGEALPLSENADIGFVADVKSGSFDIAWNKASFWLPMPNPHNKSNANVLIPWFNGSDITKRSRGMWIIDFGNDMSQQEAALYEQPFAYVHEHVKPGRDRVKRAKYRTKWWIHAEPCDNMRKAIGPLRRFVATPVLTKHRLFVRVTDRSLPDHQVVVFARSDDYFFGVLHSCVHELWARRVGTQLREAESGSRYTPTTCFETFPLPWSPGEEPAKAKTKHHALWKAISDAAARLDKLRENWLNPTEWIREIEGLVDIRHRGEIDAVPEDVRPLVRRSAIMAEAAIDPKLKKRTLTNLYNERPAWLRLAHEKLDRAVLAAYAAVDPKGDWDPDWARVYEPFGAGSITIKRAGRGADNAETIGKKEGAIEAREPIDQRILASLLRLNHQRGES